MSRLLRWSFPVVCFVCFLAPEAARAANILIMDDDVSGITFSVNDFEGGFSVNGTQIPIGLDSPATMSYSETSPVTFSGTWITYASATPSSQTVYFVEASDPTTVSDILQYNVSNNSDDVTSIISGSFTSDPGGGLPYTLPSGVSPSDVVVEPTSFSFDQAYLSATASSDSDVNAVPEPTTLASAVTGVLLMLGYSWRRRRTARVAVV